MTDISHNPLDDLFPDEVGDEATEPETQETNPLHESFINDLPEDLREYGQQLVPHWDKYVQNQFQEAAQYRQQTDPLVSPLLEAGATPEEIQWYVENREAILQGNAPDGEGGSGEEFQYDDPYVANGYEDPRIAQLQAELQEVKGFVENFQTIEQQRQQEQVMQTVEQEIKTEIAQIKEQYPNLSKSDADYICTLAGQYINEEGATTHDIIAKGFADFQAIAAAAERQLFDKKVAQPTPAERGGVPDTTPETITNFEDAGKAALARVRQSMGT